MQLTFNQPHKSIKNFSTVNLPNFTVITGLNGSGKTHLLEAIDESYIATDIATANYREIRLFDWSKLVPNNDTAVNFDEIDRNYSYWDELSDYIESARNQIYGIIEHLKIDNKDIDCFSNLVNMTEKDWSTKITDPKKAKQIFRKIHFVLDKLDSKFANICNSRRDFCYLLNYLKKNCDIPLILITEKEFYQYSPPLIWKTEDFFQNSLSRVFMEYNKCLFDNSINELRAGKGKDAKYFNDEEFFQYYGNPPWEIVNNILNLMKLDFFIPEPDPYNYTNFYEAKLIHKITQEEIPFANLSSGEKILISFSLCLYHAEDIRNIVEYPKLLLFDEVDANLHPSMINSLLKIIQEMLVKQYGIKVILTTHSPSTVALAPEESLYVMQKEGSRRLEKVSKDKAISVLTSGVPTLSIDPENRRQVFVESKYDEENYEKIYQKLKKYSSLNPEISLHFLSLGIDGENCDAVKTTVNKLTKFGNRNIYGIIDWDLKSNGNDRVKILGKNKRYSIENYIFDPILVAYFLLREKFVDRSDLGLKENENFSDIPQFNNEKAQLVADFIINKFRGDGSLETDEEICECEYISKQKINLPKWFLEMKGHHLETKLKEIFPHLRRYNQKDNHLKSEILSKVVDDVPPLLSKDFIELFQEIQNIDY